MPVAHSGAHVFSDRGVKMVGVLTRPAAAEARKVPGVLFLHGLPGAEKNVDIQRLLMKKGIASYELHFQGAWGSGGEYRVSDLVRQAASGLRFLASLPCIDRGRLAVFGFSMGGWAAIHLAARRPRLKALVAVAPVGGPEILGPGTREAVAGLCRPLRARSADLVARDFIASVRRFDPAKSAARLRVPFLLVHGTADATVPFAVSPRIFAAAPSPKKFVSAPGARHDFLDRREWLSSLVAGWLARRLSGSRRA
jgi:dipeptidyl aminopeptidase/acylaminoacyl peptidase